MREGGRRRAAAGRLCKHGWSLQAKSDAISTATGRRLANWGLQCAQDLRNEPCRYSVVSRTHDHVSSASVYPVGPCKLWPAMSTAPGCSRCGSTLPLCRERFLLISYQRPQQSAATGLDQHAAGFSQRFMGERRDPQRLENARECGCWNIFTSLHQGAGHVRNLVHSLRAGT